MELSVKIHEFRRYCMAEVDKDYPVLERPPLVNSTPLDEDQSEDYCTFGNDSISKRRRIDISTATILAYKEKHNEYIDDAE